jgi:hypothetical protein
MGGRKMVVSEGVPSFFCPPFFAYRFWIRPQAPPSLPRSEFFFPCEFVATDRPCWSTATLGSLLKHVNCYPIRNIK